MRSDSRRQLLLEKSSSGGGYGAVPSQEASETQPKKCLSDETKRWLLRAGYASCFVAVVVLLGVGIDSYASGNAKVEKLQSRFGNDLLVPTNYTNRERNPNATNPDDIFHYSCMSAVGLILSISNVSGANVSHWLNNPRILDGSCDFLSVAADNATALQNSLRSEYIIRTYPGGLQQVADICFGICESISEAHSAIASSQYFMVAAAVLLFAYTAVILIKDLQEAYKNCPSSKCVRSFCRA